MLKIFLQYTACDQLSRLGSCVAEILKNERTEE
jgi:hypothetical protein